MQFRKLEREDLPRLLPYFQAQQGKIGNYSAGLLFMWGRYLSTQYCEEDGCLFLIDHYFGNSYFYYPLSKDGDEAAEERGIEKIEAYCRENDVRLHFTNVPREKLPSLALRYGADVHISDIRRWRDYLYDAESFRTYPGGKYSGQRNHVNKFKNQQIQKDVSRFRVLHLRAGGFARGGGVLKGIFRVAVRQGGYLCRRGNEGRV